jgi:3-oxoacyl-[acyl-carrier-protein] synthase II
LGIETPRRIVVTGIGAVTPLGNDVAALWQGLCHGHSGVGPITLFDARAYRTRIAAEVRGLAAPQGIEPRDVRSFDRSALFALTAATEAWADSCLSRQSTDPFEIGALISSSHGGEMSLLAEIDAVLKRTGKRVSPRLIPRTLSNMSSAQVAIRLGLRGPSFGISSACASGAQAIGEASEIIRRGDAIAMLCGGTDACITPLTIAGDDAAGALSRHNRDPRRASRPFARDRDGFVVGEGAGVLVIEDMQHALDRGAHLYGEIAGYGASTDGYHETRPDPDGAALVRAIERSLLKAGAESGAVDAIFAHATGTRQGDIAEARAFHQAFGDRIAALPVTAIKASLGHLMGAAGAVQAIVALMALRAGMLPPTLNLDPPDPACALCIVTGLTPLPALSCVLTSSMGFGGHNVALVLRKIWA